MKKVLFVLVFIMAALVVNAQTQPTPTQEKQKATTPTQEVQKATTPTQEMQKATVVKEADLPKAINENLAKDYAGYTVKGASSTNKDNVLTYDVVIVKGDITETLVYDKDGKFVKKLVKPEASK
jgi:hypothetical protein